MKLDEVIVNIEKDSGWSNYVSADVYRTADSHGHQEFLGRKHIRPFHPQMAGSGCNNVILFVDDEEEITGGQISRFSPDEGLHTIIF